MSSAPLYYPQMSQMGYMNGPPQSPQPGYQQPNMHTPGMYTPQAQPMSQNFAQIAKQRPASSMGQPQPKANPAPSPAFSRPARKSAAIVIKRPDGEALDVESFKAQPKPSTRHVRSDSAVIKDAAVATAEIIQKFKEEKTQKAKEAEGAEEAKEADIAACLKKLTTYYDFTIEKVPVRDPKKEKATWTRAEVTEERIAQEDIVKRVKKLNESRKTVREKKEALATFQQGQINSLLDDQASQERDPNFEWSLAQLDTKTKPVGSKTWEKWQYETISITVYLKRAPRKDLDPIILLKKIERNEAEPWRPRPPRNSGHGADKERRNASVAEEDGEAQELERETERLANYNLQSPLAGGPVIAPKQSFTTRPYVPGSTGPYVPDSTSDSGSSAVSTYSDDSSQQKQPGIAESTIPTTVSGAPQQSKDDHEDTETIRTDVQSLHLDPSLKDTLIKEAATRIRDRVLENSELGGDSLSRASAALPALLKEFALELSSTAEPGMQKDAVTFIRHYRRYGLYNFLPSARIIILDSTWTSLADILCLFLVGFLAC